MGTGFEFGVAFVGCKPGSSSDLDIEVTMIFQNVTGAAVPIEIIEGRLLSEVGQSSFPMSPTSFTIEPSSELAVGLVKSGPGVGTDACDFCNSVQIDLEVEFRAGGVPHTFTDALDSISCAL